MDDVDPRLVRFRIRSLLVVMIAVAATAAMVSKAAPYVQALIRDREYEKVLTIVAFAGVAIVPLAFVLVVRLAKVGLSAPGSSASRAGQPRSKR